MAELVLDRHLLGDIAELNTGFLRLIGAAASACRDDSEPVLGLSASLAGSVARLPESRRREMARCPYTLFSLRPDDAAFWTAVRDGHVPGSYQKPQTASPVSVSGFLLTALMHARNLLANDQRFAARLSLGVAAGEGAFVECVSPVVLKEVAFAAPGLLTARFASNPRFWPDLVRAARNGTAVQRHAARMLGVQLTIPVED